MFETRLKESKIKFTLFLETKKRKKKEDFASNPQTIVKVNVPPYLRSHCCTKSL